MDNKIDLLGLEKWNSVGDIYQLTIWVPLIDSLSKLQVPSNSAEELAGQCGN